MYKFLTPGPINVSFMTKDRMLEEPPYFASPEFGELLHEIKEPLKRVFQTNNPVLIGSGSGTLAMEACMTNFLEPGDSVIIISAGKYGDNWCKMAEYNGLGVINVKVHLPDSKLGWKQVLSKLEYNLKVYNGYKAVFVTHCETTTAAWAPIRDIADCVRKYSNALVIVDAVSTLAVTELRADLFDVVISASQKGLQLPPGLFFMTVSSYAFAKACGTKRRSFYFDVKTEIERYYKNETSHTPATYLFNPLLHVLRNIEAQFGGVYSIYEHCKDLQKEVLAVLEMYAVPIWSTSPVCTAIMTPHAPEVLLRMKDKGWYVGGGVREYADKMIRIMHFGWATEKEFLTEGVDTLCNTYFDVYEDEEDVDDDS